MKELFDFRKPYETEDQEPCIGPGEWVGAVDSLGKVMGVKVDPVLVDGIYIYNDFLVMSGNWTDYDTCVAGVEFDRPEFHIEIPREHVRYCVTLTLKSRLYKTADGRETLIYFTMSPTYDMSKELYKNSN